MRRQMHLWDGGWQRSLYMGTHVRAGAQVGLAHGWLDVGMGAGRLEGTLGWTLAPGVAAAQWLHGGVDLCVRLCS